MNCIEMNTDPITYKTNAAKEDEIHAHFQECEAAFIEQLIARVDIVEYAKKIYRKAIRFEAWRHGRLIGLVAVYFDETRKHCAYITHTGVVKSHMRLGIASKLLEECVDQAEGRNIDRIELEVYEHNLPAIALYQKHGFIEFDRKGDFIQMRRSMNQSDHPQRK